MHSSRYDRCSPSAEVAPANCRCRRIANRESARRVRQKRQDVMEDLQVKINALQAQNQRLMSHVGEVEAHKGMLTGQVTQLRSKWTAATNDNMRLQAELATLRKTLQVCLAGSMTRLCGTLSSGFGTLSCACTAMSKRVA